MAYKTYGGPIPKSITDSAAIRRADAAGQIAEIGNEWADGYWVYLTPGWVNPGLETHCYHEWTVRDLLTAIRASPPERCDASNCPAGCGVAH